MSVQMHVAKYFMRRTKRRVTARLQGRIRSIAKSRAWMERMFGKLKLAKGVRQEPLKVGEMDAEWHLPENYGDKVVLFLHGGGYFSGSIKCYRSLASKIAKECRVRLLAVEYRLAPENPYPAALEDATFAFQWLLDQGIAAKNIVIAGDSAGGGLTLATVTALRDAGKELPAGMVLISPWTDLTSSGDSYQSRAEIDPFLSPAFLAQVGSFYAKETAKEDPGVSPFYANMEGLCPTLIQVGDEEILLDDSVIVARKMEEAKVAVELQVCKGGFHVYHIAWHYLPEARRSIKEIARFVGTI